MTLSGADPRERLRQRCGHTGLTHIWKDVRLELIRGWIHAVAEVALNLVALDAGLAHRLLAEEPAPHCVSLELD